MKLLFLGAGSGLGRDLNNFQSNMLLLTDEGKKLLIDCGTDIRFSLMQARYLPKDIDAVFISHLHADHIGGLEWFALQRKFVCQTPPSKLIIHKELASMLWEHSLSGGLKTLEDQEASLQDYFVVQKVADSNIYEWEGIHLTMVKTVHIHSNGEVMPSYGLVISYKRKKYFLTADTQFIPDILGKFYEEATIIFHDCETLLAPSGVHAHFNQLSTLASDIKKKMWLYHYNDGELPDAHAEGFCGFVRCGQVFDLK
ncbi:MAG: MBL fold metallo-hydrolase [Legionella sp.]|uniref:MBL fold metallo-hydrolase n=1 Tax=Legionella sp. TaxID=459 RepID=UPI0039E72B85